MDIFLIIGIIVGLGAVLTGLLMKGASVAILFSPEAIMVILVGTSAAIMNSFTKKEFLNIPKLFGVIFKDKQKEDPVEIIKLIVELSQETRKNGLLSLESKIQELSNEFMKQGLEMVVDGTEPEYIRQILSDDIEAMQERHRNNASIFTTAGGASPTLGVLGAVIGLIGALGNLNDTEKLGESIAAAFVATLYGIFFGYVIWHPFASRLKRKSHEEVSNRNLIMEGILALQEGKNPKTIQTKLLTLVNPKDRKRYLEANKQE
ncbi:flagellar motor protein MotA [Clostridiales bacterium oral taxon 876 str. F0540]|nr:flagellar motor protein MotA [Clostridiales bacterium oral taxon 876 str. F0540]